MENRDTFLAVESLQLLAESRYLLVATKNIGGAEAVKKDGCIKTAVKKGYTKLKIFW